MCAKLSARRKSPQTSSPPISKAVWNFSKWSVLRVTKLGSVRSGDPDANPPSGSLNTHNWQNARAWRDGLNVPSSCGILDFLDSSEEPMPASILNYGICYAPAGTQTSFLASIVVPSASPTPMAVNFSSSSSRSTRYTAISVSIGTPPLFKGYTSEASCFLPFPRFSAISVYLEGCRIVASCSLL